MYFENINESRAMFFTTWDRYQKNQPLSEMEAQLIDVMMMHPEYHCLFDNPEASETLLQSFDENPFLHLGLHLGIRDQIRMNNPAELSTIYQQLLKKTADHHAVEHQMMEQLAFYLWEIQKKQQMIDIRTYVEACRKLVTL